MVIILFNTLSDRLNLKYMLIFGAYEVYIALKRKQKLLNLKYMLIFGAYEVYIDSIGKYTKTVLLKIKSPQRLS